VQPGLQITAIRVTYSEHSEQHIKHRLVSQSVSFGAKIFLNWLGNNNHKTALKNLYHATGVLYSIRNYGNIEPET